MDRQDVLTSARHAGSVVRYHTWPTHQRQTVADHSWNVMRIYWQIWGPLPPEVSTYIIWHDTGELVTGDLPYPVKVRHPLLKMICDEVEREAVVSMGGPSPAANGLSAELKARVKICDLLDMLEFGLVERQLGSQLAQPIIDDICQAVLEFKANLSAGDWTLACEYVCKTYPKLGLDVWRGAYD